MYQRTLAQLRTSVQQLGSWERSADLTATVLNQYINDAIEETYNICVACRDDYYVKVSSAITLVVGTDTYALPSDLYTLRQVEIAMDAAQTRWQRLLPVPVDGANRVTQYGLTAKRYRYRLSNQGLTLSPVPAAVDYIRVYYIPLAPQLVADSDAIAFDRPVEQKLVIQIAVRDCYQRQDLETGAQDALIAKYTQQLRTVADTHDDGEPFILSKRGPEADDEDGYF